MKLYVIKSILLEGRKFDYRLEQRKPNSIPSAEVIADNSNEGHGPCERGFLDQTGHNKVDEDHLKVIRLSE